MAEEPTCGLGLAEHAPLPAKMAELTACVAENLEVHLRALDVEDEHARQEHAVYRKLVAAHREAAERLRATAAAMAGSRDLPMGRHDMTAMSSASVSEAFARFVEAERELLVLLQARVEEDQAMLAEMGSAGGRPA